MMGVGWIEIFAPHAPYNDYGPLLSHDLGGVLGT